MTCQACMHRDRLRRELGEKVARHLRVVESLQRDILVALPDELPRLRAEVQALEPTQPTGTAP